MTLLESADRQAAVETLARWLAPSAAQQQATLLDAPPPDIVEWAHRNYYISETRYPIVLRPHQQTFLRWAANCGMPNILYSTVKKSGKTAISGLFSRYRAEFSGHGAEVYFIANDKEQAKDRAYLSALASIELTPGYHRSRRELPGQWRILERQATHEPSSSFMRAIAGDYEGAAGGNPILTSWTELWAFTTERFVRLWEELTPVPTRERSERLVETYAGFIDESKLLYDLYKNAVVAGHRLSRQELTKYAGSDQDPWPFEDEPRFYINEAARTFAYWDDGEPAQKRMPWQTTERGLAFFAEKRATERKEAWERHWLNYWVSSSQTFIETAWWRACTGPLPIDPTTGRPLAALPANWPIVIAVDGSINSDCTAAVAVAREPVWDADTRTWKPSDTDVRVVFARVWVPPKGGVIDLDDVENHLRAWCGHKATLPEPVSRGGTLADDEYTLYIALPEYNVAEVTYDQYQLHQMMTALNKDFVAWCKPFSQAGEREVADKQLYDMILRRGIHHQNEIDEEYVSNCAAYVAGTNAKNQDRLRIVKKSSDAKVDPVVCLSMAARECLRLLLS